MLMFFSVFCLIFVFDFGLASPPTVETIFGNLEGLEYRTSNGKDAEIFLGIPFASPPIGDLRHEKPQPPQKWDGTRSATSFGPQCITHNPLIIPGKEDCLYLNIFRPKSRLTSEGLPVLVWVHGGAYVFGSTDFYGYKNISDNFVSEGMIVVTVTYRLGPWGFFSSGDSRIPGNLGLWDLTQALQFLREVLPQFGGDPSKITLWGHSAGSGAVSWLTASPRSNRLFSQSIEMSGSVYAHWTSQREVIEWSKHISKALGCDFSASNLRQCLKDAPIDEYLALGKNWPMFQTGKTFAYFNPILDNDFLQIEASFDDAFAKAPKKPTLLGMTSQEGLLFTSQVPPLFQEDRPFFLSSKSVENYKKEDLQAYIRHFIANENDFGKNAVEVAKEIIEFYTRGEKSDKNFYFQKFTELVSDILFNVAVIREAKIKASNGFPTYLYLYNHDIPQATSNLQIPGTPHAAEWTPLFGLFFFGGPFEFSEADKKAQQNFIQTFVSFVKTGQPKTAEIEFPKTSASELEYVEISDAPKNQKQLFAECFQFWEDLAQKYGVDIIQGQILKKAGKAKTEL